MSTLEKSGQWTFKKANGQPATDMTDACVGTTDDPHDELAWTDAAVDENRRLQSINVREKQKSAVLRSENKSLRSDVKSLRRQLEVSDYEKKKMQLTMEKEREKMQVRCPPHEHGNLLPTLPCGSTFYRHSALLADLCSFGLLYELVARLP